MNSPTPCGLSEKIREEAIPIWDELVKAGWTFGTIHWERERERKLEFSAKSPRGVRVYISCEEDALPGKLQGLLDSR